MKIIRTDFNKITIEDDLTIAIGNFDGLHVGHNLLIEEVLKYKDTKASILTFSPHAQVYFKGPDFKILTTDDDKIEIGEKYNLDYFIIVNFTKEFSSLNQDEFISFLKHINVKRIVLGKDAKFAKKGSVDKNILRDYFDVVVVEDYNDNSTRVSSTYIKKLLSKGNIEEANKYLARNYKINGIVTHGNKVGTKLGFPTANIKYNNYFLPKDGVYFVKIDKHYGICNIGNNPSINYSKTKRLEVYIFDFKQNIYNKEISIEFIKYMRSEIKFNSKEELINQLKIDEELARSMI